MYRVRTARCACCDLMLDIAVDPDDPFATPVCARCYLHQDDPWLQGVDHVAMFRRALEDTRDALSLAEGERDFYRERATTTAQSGETLVRVLSEIDHLHHLVGTRCSCGLWDCRVMELLSDPAVGRLVGSYDEERHTLYELRRANPGAWAGVTSDGWDDIDVTLVYPQPTHAGGGRHRAAG